MSSFAISVEQFLSIFFKGHFLELRAIVLHTKAAECLFVDRSEMSRALAFLKRHASRELYHGCTERLTRDDGSVRGCGNAYVLWCDVDFKDVAEHEARPLLEAFPLTPSV